MKLRCAILDDYQNAAMTLADWSSIAGKVDVTPFHQHFEKEEDLIAAIRDCQIVVIMRERTPFGESLLSRLPNLKLLITSGMRNASIDLKSATSRGVTVCGTASGSEPPTELTWALIMSLARNIPQENLAFRNNGPWQSTVGADLHGKNLGLLGFGKIGSKVARVGLAFGMKVSAWSQNLTAEKTNPAGVTLAASKDELLENSDFVSIHLVLSERTKGLIGAADLKKMRPSAYLINTSRASIIDQDALVGALKNRQIAGVGLDVFDVEPLPAGHALRTLANVLGTPHLGYVSQSNYRTYFREAVEDIQAFLDGAPVRTIS